MLEQAPSQSIGTPNPHARHTSSPEIVLLELDLSTGRPSGPAHPLGSFFGGPWVGEGRWKPLGLLEEKRAMWGLSQMSLQGCPHLPQAPLHHMLPGSLHRVPPGTAGLQDLINYSRRLYFGGKNPVVGCHTTLIF